MRLQALRSPLLLLAIVLLAPSFFAQQGPSVSGHAPAQASGIWLGVLSVGSVSLRLQLHLEPDASGGYRCTLDSVDQKAFGIVCNDVKVAGRDISFAVPAIAAGLAGKLSEDDSTLTATWTQGKLSLPITLTRQSRPLGAPKTPPPDAALAPLGAADLKATLDRDLAMSLRSGQLAPSTDAGITVGVVKDGIRRVFSYGTAAPESVFEIGSITKTFTGLLLAQLTAQGTVRLDQPVRTLLPPSTVAKPESRAEITLLDLSAQHSGLPRLPNNLTPADTENPYADYTAAKLYSYIGMHGVALQPGTPFGYSNLGVGLLGQVLANAAHSTYPELLETQILGPLGMRHTAVALTPELRAHLLPGHDSGHHPAAAWDLDVLAGAGGIRSTADDMLTYLEAQLHPDQLTRLHPDQLARPHPDRLARTLLDEMNGKTLPAAIAASHEVHGQAMDGNHIALNWFRIDATGEFWHNGATGGYSAYALFNPEADFALIVLSNTAVGQDSFADRLGKHIEQRLTGKPAVALAP